MIRRKNRNKIGGEESGGDSSRDNVGLTIAHSVPPPIHSILLLVPNNNLLLPNTLFGSDTNNHCH